MTRGKRMQPERLSGKTLKRDAIVRTATIYEIAELHRNDVATRKSSNKLWQAGGKARFIYLPPGYNNDPCMLRHTAGCSFNTQDEPKFPLIDLEAYSVSHGDRAEGVSHRERLSEETQMGCDSPTNATKGVEVGRNDLSSSYGVTSPSYQGQCINEVVHSKFSLIDLETYTYEAQAA